MRQISQTDAERLCEIRNWFRRHMRDRCTYAGCTAMPDIWADHFAFLLRMLESRPAEDAVDPHASDQGTPATRA